MAGVPSRRFGMCTSIQPASGVAPDHQSSQEGTGHCPSEVPILAAQTSRTEPDRAAGSREGLTPAEGRAESVPEAGGTGAEAVGTPTAPTAGHDAELSPARIDDLDRRLIGGQQGNVRRRALGRSARRKPHVLPSRDRRRSGGFRGDRRGAAALPLATARVFFVA